MNSNTYTSADIVLYNTKTGTRVTEKSLVAYDTVSYKILAVGNEADRLSITNNQACVSPFRLGEVSDFTVATALMKQLIKREITGKIMKPVLAVCLPRFENAVASKAFEELFLVAGARRADIFYDVTLDEFINNHSKELGHYSGIIWITKVDKSEYAKELLSDTYERLKGWGFSGEWQLNMLKEIKEK